MMTLKAPQKALIQQQEMWEDFEKVAEFEAFESYGIPLSFAQKQKIREVEDAMVRINIHEMIKELLVPDDTIAEDGKVLHQIASLSVYQLFSQWAWVPSCKCH
jgi:hypothetical protein